MDGLNFKCATNILERFFTVDEYGSFIPSQDKLLMDVAQQRFKKQLATDTGFYRRLAEIYDRTDVEFTDNPHGNTPVIGAGYKLIGKRPLNVGAKGRRDRVGGKGQKLDKTLESRERKIEGLHNELTNVYDSIKPTLKDDRDGLLYDVEGDQKNTGGGYDGNHIGGVTESALNFVIDSSSPIDYEGTVLSQYVVEGCLWVRELLMKSGLALGSLSPQPASLVRANQDNDGMFGYPVFASGYEPWDEDLAQRLLIETGVSTFHLVGSTVYDKYRQTSRQFAVIDAAAYILDNKVFDVDDMLSLVILLARIQKHGWKYEDGKLTPKPGKTRSVYPNAFIPAVIESMPIAAFNDKLQELKVEILPSIQDKPTRVEIIRKQIVNAIENGFDYLAADWSKYDATIRGSILATIVQLVVKPFFNAKWYSWLDAVTYILVYKYLIVSTPLAQLKPDMYEDAKRASKYFIQAKYTVFGLCDGLISGAKFTHVGGSLYGEVVIHYCIGRYLGWKPIYGAQAGDDTLMGVPQTFIFPDSVERTYQPILDVAAKFGLRANASKQIWHQRDGEIVKVFLQDAFHYHQDIWGVGSIFRPADAVWYSERNKGLSIAEQLMAEISRLNQGADSPFVRPVVKWVLEKERYLGWVFKEYGVSGFQKLVDVIGKSTDELVSSIDVGSFTFGVDRKDIEAGTLPILPILAEVASEMPFSSEDRASFLEGLSEQDEEVGFVDNSQVDDDDSID